jgi:hypothetical protein
MMLTAARRPLRSPLLLRATAGNEPTDHLNEGNRAMRTILPLLTLLALVASPVYAQKNANSGEQCMCEKCQQARQAAAQAQAQQAAAQSGAYGNQPGAGPVQQAVLFAPDGALNSGVQLVGHPMAYGNCPPAYGHYGHHVRGYGYHHPGGGYGPYGGAHMTPGYPHHHFHREYVGPQGPPSAHVAYPYYTIRGPRDFLLDNPPSIGR